MGHQGVEPFRHPPKYFYAKWFTATRRENDPSNRMNSRKHPRHGPGFWILWRCESPLEPKPRSSDTGRTKLPPVSDPDDNNNGYGSACSWTYLYIRWGCVSTYFFVAHFHDPYLGANTGKKRRKSAALAAWRNAHRSRALPNILEERRGVCGIYRDDH